VRDLALGAAHRCGNRQAHLRCVETAFGQPRGCGCRRRGRRARLRGGQLDVGQRHRAVDTGAVQAVGIQAELLRPPPRRGADPGAPAFARDRLQRRRY